MDQAATELFLIRKEAPMTAGDRRLQARSDSHFVATDYLVPRAFPGIVKLCDFQLERLGDGIEKSKARLFP